MRSATTARSWASTATHCGVLVSIDEQSPDIDQGVSAALEVRTGTGGEDALNAQGAGDQGMMFGYACDETPDLMPLPIWLAHRLARRLAEVRKAGAIPYLGPDGKTQVSVRYEDGRPVELDDGADLDPARQGRRPRRQLPGDLVEHVITPLLPTGLETDGYRLLANPTGRFELGGPAADTGLTGRKIIVDTYGGWARHGGGAFSGKDPSKVDRSGAYAARWVAKHVVAVRRRLPLRDPGRLRDRRRPSDLGDGRHLRDRDRRPRARSRRRSTSCSTSARRRSCEISTCAGPSTARSPPTATSGARPTEVPWEATPRVDDLRAALGL